MSLVCSRVLYYASKYLFHTLHVASSRADPEIFFGGGGGGGSTYSLVHGVRHISTLTIDITEPIEGVYLY